MKEYISKEYIDNLLERYLDRWHGPEYYACSVIQDEINNTPDSESVHVHEAEWTFGKEPRIDTIIGDVVFDDVAICSWCSYSVPVRNAKHQCPYCGAVMKKEN